MLTLHIYTTNTIMRSSIFEDIYYTATALTSTYEYNSFSSLYDDVIEELGGREDPDSYVVNSYISTDAIENWLDELRQYTDDPHEMELDDRWIYGVTYREIDPLKVKNTLQILMILYSATRNYSNQRSPYVRRSIQFFRFRVLYEMMYCFSANFCMFLTPKMKRQITIDLEEIVGKTFHQLYCDLLKYGRGNYQDESWVPAYHVNMNTTMHTCGYTNAC
jgi:hypothetical protein